MRMCRTRFGLLTHWMHPTRDATLCGGSADVFVIFDGIVNCPRCITAAARRTPTPVQRPEVAINGRLHRRPEVGSERCACGWTPGKDRAGTWADHIYHILITLEHER